MGSNCECCETKHPKENDVNLFEDSNIKDNGNKTISILKSNLRNNQDSNFLSFYDLDKKNTDSDENSEDVILQENNVLIDEDSKEKKVKEENINNNHAGGFLRLSGNESLLSKTDSFNFRALNLINEIRKNPSEYSKTVLSNIKYISKKIVTKVNKDTGIEEDHNFLLYIKKVKIALNNGEPTFRQAAEFLKNTRPMNSLKIKRDIIIDLPDDIKKLNDKRYFENKVENIRRFSNLNVYFKNYIKNPEIAVLFMIVDDNDYNNGGYDFSLLHKKRTAILNPEFSKIGINCKFYGKKFVSVFSFAK